jgi:hypothetical protein
MNSKRHERLVTIETPRYNIGLLKDYIKLRLFSGDCIHGVNNRCKGADCQDFQTKQE